ncbi:hypothetical protein GCM10017784_35210 [Deinococcus indicus]|nr:hypothetical protein [Deinococcus indicus]GHG37719.1 hypothetical protein GCM10017784_35210 [Deinococcus indicus]
MSNDPHPRCRHCGGQLPRVGVCGSPACTARRRHATETRRAAKLAQEALK